MATKKKALKKRKRAVDPKKLEQWKKQGRAFGVSQHQWDIAEWILRGEEIFASITKAYDEATKLTGMTRATLQSFASTARSVNSLTRVKELSFGHHRLVMKYPTEKQKELLNYAKEAGESVDSFAAYLRTLDGDAEDDDRTPADKAADKVMERCDELLQNHNFAKLLKEPPTAKRSELVDKLKEVAAELNRKVEMLMTAWREYDEADAAFQQASLDEDKAMGVGAGQ